MYQLHGRLQGLQYGGKVHGDCPLVYRRRGVRCLLYVFRLGTDYPRRIF